MFGDLNDNKRRKEILSYHSNHSNQRTSGRMSLTIGEFDTRPQYLSAGMPDLFRAGH